MWVGFIEVNLIFLEVFFIKQELLINEKIRAKEVQLIGAKLEQHILEVLYSGIMLITLGINGQKKHIVVISS